MRYRFCLLNELANITVGDRPPKIHVGNGPQFKLGPSEFDEGGWRIRLTLYNVDSTSWADSGDRP